MSRTLLWLLASLAFVSLTSLADGAALKLMSAPNLLRVGTAENIFVECQDCTGGNIPVQIHVMNHPAKTRRLTSTSVTLTSERNFQELGQITIPVGNFSKAPTMKQYVYLQAQFPDKVLEKVVLVSFQSGYIFIQTDKTLYTPNSKVHYRMFAVTPRMEPVERDAEAQTDAAIAIEIVTPEGIILPCDTVFLRSGIHSGGFPLAETISTGLWKVVAKFKSNPQQSYSAEFEVKEYVLPSFEVKLIPESSFFYVDSRELTVNIKASYLFGQEVDGMAYVVFGVMQENSKKSFPSSLQRVQISEGIGVVKLEREHITQTFPNILELVGRSIYVAVSVLTESGGEMVEAELRSIQIVTSPYTITFKKTPKYFKPGILFNVAVEVVNPDGTPAERVPVVVDPGQVQALTTANGMAKLSINTEAREQRLTITARTNDPHISHERQVSATMVALPYTTRSNNYIHISVDTAELELGDTLKVNLILKRQENHDKDITYLILNRGQLVKNGRFNTRSHVVNTLKVTVTKEMLPSFRIIAYYHTNGNEVVSDSVWVDVKDSCMGSLRLESSNPYRSYGPRKRFGLKITGDPGATVGLVAVDKGVYVLNNKHRLTQKKVWDIVEKYDTGCTPGGGKDGMGVFYDAGLLFESNTASGTPDRQGEEDNSYMDSNEIFSRTYFHESWLWSDFILPACPQENPNCDTTTLMKTIPLLDSMTTLQFTGISLSRTHGICVGEPLEVIIRKEFFIDLRLPYSAVRQEQLEIKAILHNNSPDPLTVLVDLTEEEHVCSSAFKRGKYRQEVKMGAQTTQAVPFIIIPMKEGKYNIEVKAAVKDSLLNDGIIKKLLVVPEGVLVKSPQIILLDPTTKGVGGQQEETLNSGIPFKDLVRNTPTSTQFFVTGRKQVSALVENVVSGNSMGTLIIQPSGNGLLNMDGMTLPVIAATYLDKTNQWETVGLQKRNEALQHIKTGYQNELVFRKSDGSFAVFQQKESSTWLTAYVAKVFAMANNLVEMQSQHICEAIRFLILNAQQTDGEFREIGFMYSNTIRSGVVERESDASMTAFCLIAMQESRPLCAASVNMLQTSIHKAVAYLERRLPHLTYSYAVAMTSYALANEKKLNKEILYKFASQELSHWPVSTGHVYTLEATAYALLALVKAEAFEEARPVVRWFNTQQRVHGGYGSTQATIMVYQAIAEYWASAKEPDYDLNVDIFWPGRSKPDRYYFNRDNYYTTRTSEIEGINHNVTVTATGIGEATVTMVSLYYAMPKEKESDCQKFNLSVQLLPDVDGNENIYKLKMEIFYKDKDRDASMSILDIGLLTGFTVNTNDLDLLSKGRASIIAKYEMNTVLSERGSLIIYLDKVSHTRPEEITFRIHQELKVGVLQPAAVSVYEYYDQTHCVKFYQPERKAGKLVLCTNDECRCAEENCSMQKKEKIPNEQRTAKVCENTQTSIIDFVYKVRLETFTEGLSTDIFTVKVLEVIKEGSLDVGPLNKQRTFLSHPHCRKSLGLRMGKTYLIMGTSNDIHRVDGPELYQYVFGESIWIEYWPTAAECQTKEHRITCLDMEEMMIQHQLSGCQQ
ncbi:complement C3 isoform X2 [Perca flavescens]|uniref:complement C3 isoform X2 n=1 Tax=Perca flavescens TaxID=8167 RepID=UPI00106EC2E9|nr:complement C3-like isoform X2 [Perca flavescens]